MRNKNELSHWNTKVVDRGPLSEFSNFKPLDYPKVQRSGKRHILNKGEIDYAPDVDVFHTP